MHYYSSTHWSVSWAEAPIKIARMTLTIKLDGNWSSFQLANNTPPLSVTGSVIAPSARMSAQEAPEMDKNRMQTSQCFSVSALLLGRNSTKGDLKRPLHETLRCVHCKPPRFGGPNLETSQRSLHYAPIFRLLLKVAVIGACQCE